MLIALEPEDRRPLHQQVYDGLRDAILDGRLASGARLPSTRALAADLGVARNTVIAAFDQLRVEGYVAGRRGGGTRVRASIPDSLLHVRSTSRARAGRRSATASSARIEAPGKSSTNAPAANARLSDRGKMLAAAGSTFLRRAGMPPIPFQLGVPALDAFPSRLWARLLSRRWRHGNVALGDGDAGGEAALRAAIATYIANARGARCSAEQVMVVSGAQQALDIIARVMLDPGDPVWIEDPGYFGARTAFGAAGARLVPVPVDQEGLRVADGEQAEPQARLAYVTPSHQFPLGAVMSATRRIALLAWARRAAAWVVEDDYDSEFRYEGRPLPCLQGVDAEQRVDHEPARVLYVGTFSKALAPALRLGYLVVPETLVDSFRAARAVIDRHTPTLGQCALADFIGEGHYARHVRRVRELYAERQATLRALAEQELSGHLAIAPDPAGLHVVGWLRHGLSDTQAADAAASEGVETSPLSRYRLRPGSDVSQALVLGYAAFDDIQIRAAIKQLRRALVSCTTS